MDKLLEISSKLNHIKNIDDTLQTIVDAAADLTQSKGSSILLFEEETQQLYFAAARSKNRDQLMEIRVPIEKSAAGWVYEQGLPLIISDARIDPLILRTAEQSIEHTTHNLLASPIIFGDVTLGTIEVINKIDKQEYTSEDQYSLETLASYVAIALQLYKIVESSEKVTQELANIEKQKTNFISITSHELRTPLGLVLGHATFLKELIQDTFHQEQLEIVIRNAERLKEIVDSLNQDGTFEIGTTRIRWQNTELNTLLNDVIDSFREEAKEREISLKSAVHYNPIYIFCDAAKLGVAIGNIIKNALVFSDAGQIVHVSLHRLPGHAHISVVDSGIGIPVEDLQRIFERFYQVETHLKRTRGGMGLGLSVTKSIVESHGGQIWVESSLGEGSAFTILLPTKVPSQE